MFSEQLIKVVSTEFFCRPYPPSHQGEGAYTPGFRLHHMVAQEDARSCEIEFFKDN